MKERLASTKKPYVDLLLIFKDLNEKFKSIIGVIPKQIRHMIINKVIQHHEAFTDIKKSIKDTENELLEKSKHWAVLSSPNFWNQPLSTCFKELDSIIQENYVDKEN